MYLLFEVITLNIKLPIVMKKLAFIKQFLSLFLFLLAFVPLVNGQNSQNESDRHMLWEVSSDNDTEAYLVGSVHLMKPSIYPLDEVYQEAFQQSDMLVFELNFDSVKVKMPGLIRELALYPPGESLKGALSPSTYKLLTTTLDSLGLPAARFQRMEPWLISIIIPGVEMRKAGYSGQSGIDLHFFNKAKEVGKEIMGLETAAYQFGLFDDLTPEMQEKFLKYSLQDIERNLQMIDEMVTAWEQGNAEKLESMMQAEMKETMPSIYNTLLVERNLNWISEIEKLIQSSEIPMIVVGAGHMVGEKGLVALLKERGYIVEQL